MNDTTRDEPKLAPCPFCGGQLTRSSAWLVHPENSCALTGFEFASHEADAWNRRAACSSLPDGPVAAKPVAYTVAREVDGRMVYITDYYLAAHEQGVKWQVLDRARREGFTGTADERLAELGWRIAALSAVSLPDGGAAERPLPEPAGTVFDDGYWLSNDKGPLRALPCYASRRTDFFTPAQMREFAALAAPSAQPPVPDAQLCKFYNVSTFPELVAAMEHHIEKLQAKLAAAPSFAPQRGREG